MDDRVKIAYEKHRNGYNCAQAVLCAYGDLLGIDEETLFAVAEGFGGGMGGMMDTCGAVTAMYMAAGLQNSCKDLQACTTKPETNALVRELAKEFKDKNQTVICRELKGVDTGKPIRSCNGCIEDAIKIMGEKIFKEEAQQV